MQCGVAVHEHSNAGAEPDSDFTATTDPLLRRAISDATDGEVVFVDPDPRISFEAGLDASPTHVTPRRDEPVEVAPNLPEARGDVVVAGKQAEPSGNRQKGRMASLRALMAPPRPATGGKLAFSMAGGTSGTAPSTLATAGAMDNAAQSVVGVSPVTGPMTSDRANQQQAATPAVLRRGALLWPVAIATVLVGAFVGANYWAAQSIANRVLPGVSVGDVDLGGVAFDEIEAKLEQNIAAPKLSIVLGSETRTLDTAGFARLDTETLAAQARDAGRGSQLPLARLFGGYMATAIEPRYVVDEAVVRKAVEQIALSVDEKPSNAVAIMYNGNALLLADKPGRSLNRAKAEASLKVAYGKTSRVTMTFDREDASVRAGALSDDIVQANARIANGLDVVVRGKHYSPSPTELAGMMVFAGTGKGVVANPAAIGAFVSGIPGSFDRAGAVNGIASTINLGKIGPINVVTKTTKLPNLANTAGPLPVQSYRYCLTGTPEQADAVRPTVQAVLGSGAPWTIGGRVAFVEARTNCNLRLGLADVNALRVLDPACATQTTCRSHNTLLIHDAAWQAAPLGWTSGLSGYRDELVGHVAGQWLGFEHATCGEVPTRPLSSPALTIPGCSPQWYVVAPDSQDTKILPGF